MPNATIMWLGPVVMLPPIPLRRRGLFVDNVPEVDLTREGVNRVGFGATIMGMGDVVIGTLITVDCESTEDFTDHTIVLTPHDQLPFTQYLEMTCTGEVADATLRDHLMEAARLTESAALTQALTVGITGLLALDSDSDSEGAGANITAAIGVIENGLAERISNGRGYIFIPPLAFAGAFAAGTVVWDGERFLSPLGHYVISDAGHTDTNLYGVGELGYAITAARFRTPGPLVNPHTNVAIDGWERTGVVLFNPDHAVRATVSA